jgi:biofilm PGA synthesis N-glycosyltransferase PgaC
MFFTGLLVVCAVTISLYYVFIFAVLNKGRKLYPAACPAIQVPLSVVICARNEGANLLRYLPEIMKQEYGEFEVIVVNDQSVDNTADVLGSFEHIYPTLKVVTVAADEAKDLQGKKYALRKGIAEAKHEVIMVTDADCYPASPKWLQKMSGGVGAEDIIVLGHSPFARVSGFLNLLQRYENSITVVQYMSYAARGLAYMGVGRNMLFSKSLFTHWDIAPYAGIKTGDDDFFVKDMAADAEVKVCLHPKSFMYTRAPQTWGAWLLQKHRHSAAGLRYSLLVKFLLGTFISSQVFFLLAIVVLSVAGQWSVLAVFPILHLLQAVCSVRIFNKINAIDIFLWKPLLDIAYALYIVILSLLLLIKRTEVWK